MAGQNYQNMMQPNMASLNQAQTPTGAQMPQLQQALNNQQIMQKLSPGAGTLAQMPTDTYLSRPRFSNNAPQLGGAPQTSFNQQPTMMPGQQQGFGNFANHLMQPTQMPAFGGTQGQPGMGLSAGMANTMVRPQVR